MFVCLRVSAVFNTISHVHYIYRNAMPTHQLFLLAFWHVTYPWFSPAKDRVKINFDGVVEPPKVVEFLFSMCSFYFRGS
jgi:hypothetical protein